MSVHPTLVHLRGLLAQGRRVVLRFNEHVKATELDPDPGMMAVALSIEHQGDGVTKVRADFRPFEDHNAPLGEANYYDASGQPTLRWQESGFYPKDGIDTLYVDTTGADGPPFDLIENPAAQALFAEYRAQPEPRASYVTWLEQRLIEARA